MSGDSALHLTMAQDYIDRVRFAQKLLEDHKTIECLSVLVELEDLMTAVLELYKEG